MNNANSPALLRSLIVYAICIPLAIIVGYSVTSISNYRDYQSIALVALLAGVLIFPLLMKWHYQLLILSWSLPLVVFFLPGHPALFIPMVATSLTISVVDRILNREKRFVTPAGVQWPLLALLAVVLLTAKLTGGFGLKSMGSDVYGGKKYIFLMIGICAFFAVIARPIPKKHANFFIALYLLGGVFRVISDFGAVMPAGLNYIYLLFPMTDLGADKMGNVELEFGRTRLAGSACAGTAVFFWLLARYGVRDLLLTGKFWRPMLFVISFVLIFLGGFRSAIIGAVILFGIVFWMEKLHRSGLMLVVVLAGMMGATLIVPMAPHLPYTFQRALAFLPLDIDPQVRMDAEGSTDWRLAMWQALLPQVPKYLLLGKGYAFSAETFNESMGHDAMFQNNIDASQDALALSSDFHNGPLSIVIPFGIWGVLAWLWFWAAGFRVLWRNYRFGDPALRHINLFLFASFVMKCFGFLFLAGSLVDGAADFGAVFGLSLALNHGISGPKKELEPKVVPATDRPPLALPAQPAFQR